METMVARLNIAHFRKKLSEEADENRWQILLRLLAEEEEKLAQLANRSRAPKEQIGGR
jgi:hypothetical protein